MQEDKGLFRTSADAYGPEYKQHLLEQYKLFVESADRVSERRTSANNYLLTVNAFLVTLYGLASSFSQNQAWFLVVPLAGVLVCITWLALISSYRNLNTAKFKVIHELEKKLPAALFDHEWEHAQRGEGRAYKPLTHIEPYIPLVFAVLYVVLALIALSSIINSPDSTTASNSTTAQVTTSPSTRSSESPSQSLGSRVPPLSRADTSGSPTSILPYIASSPVSEKEGTTFRKRRRRVREVSLIESPGSASG